MKYSYVSCNTRALENNPRVYFEICRGTPQDTRVFVNLVESCTVHYVAIFIKPTGDVIVPYGMKILHGIIFYGFTVGAITVKFNSVKYY